MNLFTLLKKDIFLLSVKIVKSCPLQVVANDGDFGAEPTDLVYSLLGSGANDIFTVSGTEDNTGEIFLNKKLDRETKSIWSFLVKAIDDGGTGLEGFAQVIVTVTDVNDHSPVFDELEYVGSVYENSAVGEWIVRLKLKIKDKTWNLLLSSSLGSKICFCYCMN